MGCSKASLSLSCLACLFVHVWVGHYRCPSWSVCPRVSLLVCVSSHSACNFVVQANKTGISYKGKKRVALETVFLLFALLCNSCVNEGFKHIVWDYWEQRHASYWCMYTRVFLALRCIFCSFQVSHHPPISVFHVTNRKDGFNISGGILARSKFYGEYMLWPKWKSTVILKDGVAAWLWLQHQWQHPCSVHSLWWVHALARREVWYDHKGNLLPMHVGCGLQQQSGWHNDEGISCGNWLRLSLINSVCVHLCNDYLTWCL